MRGTNAIGRRTLKPNNYFLPSSAFSTFSSSGGGRGRGGSNPKFNFTRTEPETSQNDALQSQQTPLPHGHGCGRGSGAPPPSNPIIPSFTSFLNAVRDPDEKSGPGIGRGRGGIVSDFKPQSSVQFSRPPQQQKQTVLPIPGLNGAGRGKVVGGTEPMLGSKEENRHILVRRMQPPRRVVVGQPEETMRVGSEEGPALQQTRMSQEEAVRNARIVLSRGGDDGGGRQREGSGRGRGRGIMGRGRGRGRRGETEWGQGRRGRGGRRKVDDAANDVVEGLGLGGDPTDAEKFANKMGLDVMNQLEEGLEEVCERMLPNPVMENFVDALDANCSVRDLVFAS